MRLARLLFFVCLVSLLVSGFTYADKVMNIEYILDASNSMNEPLPSAETKIAVAKRTLCGLVDNIAAEYKDANVGLRIYGANFQPTDTKEKGCMDSVITVPISKINADLIKQKVMSTTAAGYTPIAYSLELASKDFVKGKNNKNIIVLISDGQETCGGDPVAVAKKLAEQGFDIKIYTIGFAVSDLAQAQLKGIAEATGGAYFSAKDADQLQKSLEEITERSFEGYEAAGSDVKPSDWIAKAPVVAPGDYMGTLAMHEAKFYKVKVLKGQTVKAVLVVKKSPFEAHNNVIFQTFYIKLFDNDLNEVKEVGEVIEGNPVEVITFKADWNADKTGWVYVAVCASKNHGLKVEPISIYGENPGPSQYTLKIKLKGEGQDDKELKEHKSEMLKGGPGFEKAEVIELNKAALGEIYMKESRFYKLNISEGLKNISVKAVVRKPWYEAHNDVINMTYILKVYDEDWIELNEGKAGIALNNPMPFAINLDTDVKDNDEIYISLTASNNHSDKGTVEEKDPYTKSTDIKSMKYSILVNKK